MSLFFQSSELKIISWDVQHGNAIFIKGPNNENIVIDLGKGSFSTFGKQFSPLRHLRKKYKIKTLHCTIITHPHKDHIEDIHALNHFNIQNLITSQHIPRIRIGQNVLSQDKVIFKAYIDTLRYSFLPSREIDLGDLKIKVFSPTKCSMDNLNNHSLCIVVRYHNLKFVIPGDNEPESLQELMKNSTFRNKVANADVLWAPHHGRLSGFDSKFVDKVNPKLTIISDARDKGTSASKKYSNLSRGKTVTQKDGIVIKRKVVTTRKDGAIKIVASKSFFQSTAVFEVSVK